MNINASTFLLIEVILFFLMVIVRTLRIYPSNITHYELKRRAKGKDEAAVRELRKQKTMADLAALRNLKDTVLIVITVIYTVGYLGWLRGALVSIGILLLVNILARWNIIANLVQKIYDKYEIKLLSLVEKLHPGLKFLRIPNTQTANDFTLNSKEELLYLIEQADDTLSRNEKSLLTHVMKFQTKPVEDVMTPRSSIYSIDKKELLGPLVLDDLHKAGHNDIPVIHRDIDHIVGILHVQDLLTIDGKRSVTVEKAMQKNVCYINKDDSLEDALKALLHTSSSLFIIVDEFKKTVGLLTPGDVIQALVGQKLKSEFDQYDNLEAVAARSERGTIDK